MADTPLVDWVKHHQWLVAVVVTLLAAGAAFARWESKFETKDHVQKLAEEQRARHELMDQVAVEAQRDIAVVKSEMTNQRRDSARVEHQVGDVNMKVDEALILLRAVRMDARALRRLQEEKAP